MMDKHDVRYGWGDWARGCRWALSRWQQILVIMLLGTVFSWVAMFVVRHREPQPAQARTDRTSQVSGPPMEVEQIRYVDLPRIPGRHDHITGDFFTREQRTDTVKLPVPQTRTVGTVTASVQPDVNMPEAQVHQVLCLKAIIMGELPRAFINDDIVAIGDVLAPDEYPKHKYKVVAIDENSVTLMCGSVKTVLKLTLD